MAPCTHLVGVVASQDVDQMARAEKLISAQDGRQSLAHGLGSVEHIRRCFTGIAIAASRHFLTEIAQQNRAAEAQSLMEKAIEKDPTYARGHFNLARLRAMQGRRGDAMKLLEKALQLRPGYPAAADLLAQLQGK